MSEHHGVASVFEEEQRGKGSPWIDWVGASLAGLCAVHCLVFMVGSVAVLFTAVNLSFNPSSLFHQPGLRWLVVTIVALLAAGSLHVHGRRSGAGVKDWLLVFGVLLVVVANLTAIFPFVSELLSFTGGLLLVAGHLAQRFHHKQASVQREASPWRAVPRNIVLLLAVYACTIAVTQFPSLAEIKFLGGAEPQATRVDEAVIGWRLLAQLDMKTGELGPDLQQVVGRRVKIPGFVVPLDETGETFLFAPHAGACIHGPTPPLNQIIYVTMGEDAKTIKPWIWEPIWVTGVLVPLRVNSAFGAAGFTMRGEATEFYE